MKHLQIQLSLSRVLAVLAVLASLLCLLGGAALAEAQEKVTPPVAKTGLVYTGKAQQGVAAGANYTLTGATATNAGTHTAIATLKEGFTWSDGSTEPLEIEYTIDPATVTVYGISKSLQWTGQLQSITGVQSYGFVDARAALTGVSWYAAGTDVGGYTGTFTGTPVVTNAQGDDLTANYTFKYLDSSMLHIVRRDIAGAEIALSQDECVYDGTAKTPEVTSVTLDGVALQAGTDYTSVTYSDNITTGTATVRVTGAGNYTGTATTTFTITGTDISGAVVTLNQTEWDYACQEIKPEVTSVIFEGENFTSYRVSYADNINVGTGRVLVTGKGSYSGTAEATFTIKSVRRAKEPDTGNIAEWAPFSSSKLPGGVCHIYLTQDLTMPSTAFSGYDTLYLDLNGHTLTTNHSIVTPGEGQRFVLLDSPGGGSLKSDGDTASYSTACNAVTVCDGGVFDLYSGTISDFHDYQASYDYYNGRAVEVQEGGTFNMYGGTLKDNQCVYRKGGAIYSYYGTVRIMGGVISDNKAVDGGAIYCYKGNLYISGGEIEGNTATSNGGAIYYQKSYTSDAGIFQISGGVISGNHADRSGGGVYVDYSTLDMTGGQIYGNYLTGSGSKSGAGIVNVRGILNLSGTAAVTRNYFTNKFEYNTGGGIYNSGTATISDNARIEYNRVGSAENNSSRYNNGAGIYNSTEGTLVINGGSICGNVAYCGYGGGIYNEGYDYGRGCVEINGGTVSDNQVTAVYSGTGSGAGGGIYNKGTLTLTGGSVRSNISRYQGSAVYNDTGATTTVSGAVTVANNTSDNGGNAIYPGPVAISGALTGSSISNATAGDGAVLVGVSDGAYALTESDAAVFTSQDGRSGFLRGWDGQIYVGTEPRYALTLTGAHTDAGETFLAGTEVAVQADATENQILLGWQTSDESRPIAGADAEITVLVPDYPVSVTARILDRPAIEPRVYDGTAYAPEFPVILNGETLEKDADYTLEYADNVKAGTATVTITATAEPVWSAAIEYEISPMPVTVTGKSDEAVYDGTAHTVSGFTVQGLPEGATLAGLSHTAGGTNADTYAGAFTGAAVVTNADGADITANCQITLVPGSLVIQPRSLASASIWPADASGVSYTGAPIEPGLLVLLGDDELTAGVDYTAQFANNVAAGSADIVIRGAGNYTGEAHGTFTIQKASLLDATMTVAGPQTYTAAPIVPQVSILLGDVALTSDLDYRLTFTDNTAAGTATVKATGIGSCTGTLTGTFEIGKLGIAAAQIAVQPVTATGSAQAPALDVTVGNVELTEGVDYTAAYENNVNAGTATVTITGIGSCEGTASAEFTIGPASLRDADIEISQNVTYTGSAVLPQITATISGWTLRQGTDFTVRANNNINVGEAQLLLTGTGNCAGNVELSFNIVPRSLEDATVAVADADYTGAAIEPDPVVTLDGAELIPDEDYTVAYTDNVNAGTAHISVSGNGNYTGSVDATFTIRQASIEGAVLTVSGGASYTGAPITPSVLVDLNGKRLTADEHYTLSYEDNVNAGTAKVVVTGSGNYAGVAEKSFVILPMDMTGAEVAVIGSYTYDGNPKLPALSVDLDGIELISGTDYTVSVEDNVNAGVCGYTVTGLGNYEGTLEGEFTILPADLSAAIVTGGPALYTGAAITVDVTVTLGDATLSPGSDYQVTFSDNVNAGTAHISVTGLGNYEGTLEGTLTILPADLSAAVVTGGPALYTGAAIAVDVTVTLGDATLSPGSDYQVTFSDNVNAGTAHISVTGLGNYTGSAGGAFAIIDPQELTTLNLPANLRLIEQEAFAGVSAQRIVVPEGCETIGTRAFAGCDRLTLVELPASVTSIADDAFEKSANVCVLAPAGSSALLWAEANGVSRIATVH
ncbi:MAG: leucine-rich repeat protein [Clostridia bacterium]|nr:leucine-rich repeat protein [Clostridia bacterium]